VKGRRKERKKKGSDWISTTKKTKKNRKAQTKDEKGGRDQE
jgi:hypothetical protein